VQQQGVTVQKISTNVLVIGSLYSDNDRYSETFLPAPAPQVNSLWER
jgi:hypothetical protein